MCSPAGDVPRLSHDSRGIAFLTHLALREQVGKQGSGQQDGHPGQLPSNAILQARRQPSGGVPARGSAGSLHTDAHSPVHSPGHPAAHQQHAGPVALHPGMYVPAQQPHPLPSRFQPDVPPPGFGGPLAHMHHHLGPMGAYHTGMLTPHPIAEEGSCLMCLSFIQHAPFLAWC